jgi:16S rRNA (guanine(527)-N(7))-methyltransferase RsmG
VSFAEILEADLRDSELQIASRAQEQLVSYAKEVEHWNSSVNLTALRGAALVRRLIVEPVWVGHHLQMSGILADVGSGNGSPGIPLYITRGFSSAQLIEPRMKRAAFLRHVVAKLGLKGITVNRIRVEDLAQNSLSADWVVLQGIDPTPRMVGALSSVITETTRVVWVTSIDFAPVAGAQKLEIPNSATKVWIFRLDQT